jgi:hypothetical protein
MDLEIKHRGRIVTGEDISFINGLILDNPNDSRWALSKKLCRAWNWTQPNGALRDMVCRSFMLQLHRAGYIQLPAKKQHPPNPLANRKNPSEIKIDQTPIHTTLSEIKPLEIRQVRRNSTIIWVIAILLGNSSNILFFRTTDPLPVSPGLQLRVILVAGTGL